MTDLIELGPHNWQDYSDYWREVDAEWLQSRSLLRVNSFDELPATIPSPGVGQVAYVKDTAGRQKDLLYMYASAGGGAGIAGWAPYSPFPKFLVASEDSASRVTIGHHAGNPVTTLVNSLSLSPNGVSVLSDLTVRTSVFKVTAGLAGAGDVRIATGAGNKTVVLTTDTAGLVSDLPIKAPGFISTGGATNLGTGVTAGTLTADSLTVNGDITAKAKVTVTGVLTAASVVAAGGFSAGKGAYLGDANGAIIRRTDWTNGWPQLAVTSGVIHMSGGSTQVDNTLQVLSNRPIEFWNSTNSGRTGYIGPVVVSPSDPGGPNGTIWVQQ